MKYLESEYKMARPLECSIGKSTTFIEMRIQNVATIFKKMKYPEWGGKGDVCIFIRPPETYSFNVIIWNHISFDGWMNSNAIFEVPHLQFHIWTQD